MLFRSGGRNAALGQHALLGPARRGRRGACLQRGQSGPGRGKDRQGRAPRDSERQEPWSTSENETPKLAVVTRGEDITFVRRTKGLLSQETFDTAGRPWLRSGYDAALFSPRDIYRTGEEAPFKAVVRNSDVTTPKAFPVLFVARDPLGRKVSLDRKSVV